MNKTEFEVETNDGVRNCTSLRQATTLSYDDGIGRGDLIWASENLSFILKMMGLSTQIRKWNKDLGHATPKSISTKLILNDRGCKGSFLLSASSRTPLFEVEMEFGNQFSNFPFQSGGERYMCVQAQPAFIARTTWGPRGLYSISARAKVPLSDNSKKKLKKLYLSTHIRDGDRCSPNGLLPTHGHVRGGGHVCRGNVSFPQPTDNNFVSKLAHAWVLWDQSKDPGDRNGNGAAEFVSVVSHGKQNRVSLVSDMKNKLPDNYPMPLGRVKTDGIYKITREEGDMIYGGRYLASFNYTTNAQ